MTIFADPFVQLQAASDAAHTLAVARSAASETLERLDREGDELQALTRLIDAAIVTVKGMTE